MKISYGLLLFVAFRKLRPPEEGPVTAGSEPRGSS
jgi:hypothetical protein